MSLKRHRILQVSKGTEGGLDHIVSRISNKLNLTTVLLYDQDPCEIYKKKIFFDTWRFNSESFFLKVSSIRPLVKLLRKSELTHIQLTNPIILFLYFLLIGKKKVTTLHKTFGSGYQETFSSPVKKLSFLFFRGFVIASYVNMILLFSNKITFLTGGQKNLFKKFTPFKKSFEKKTVVIPNFISENKILRTKKNNTSFKVIFVGRFTKAKGYPLVRAAVKSLGNEIEWILIGGKDNELNKRKNVTVFETVPNSELFELYDKSSLFVLPSYSEAFPLSILEAMSRGLPVITTNIPGLNEIVDEKNGFLIKPGALSALEQGILFIKNNPSRFKEMSISSLKKVENYEERKVLEKYKKLYWELINS